MSTHAEAFSSITEAKRRFDIVDGRLDAHPHLEVALVTAFLNDQPVVLVLSFGPLPPDVLTGPAGTPVSVPDETWALLLQRYLHRRVPGTTQTIRRDPRDAITLWPPPTPKDRRN